MKERPILFNGAMVRAILEGRKSQTRRVLKNQRAYDLDACPYGQPGDRLWVREAHAFVPASAYRCSVGIQQITDPHDQDRACIYRQGFDRADGGIKWRPSIHMPRWASRLTLEITSVRVERLQDISEADALAEGIAQVVRDKLPVQQCGEYDGIDVDPVDLYRDIWESINGPGSWDANPWVWVIEFKNLESGYVR